MERSNISPTGQSNLYFAAHTKWVFKWRFPVPFSLLFGVFKYNLQLTNMAYDCIQTQVPWCQKRPLCQLFHNQCPKLIFKFVHFIKWDRWESLPPSAQELLDSSSIDCLVYCSHWCVLHSMLARCSRCEVFLIARNAAAYWVKLTRCERDFFPQILMKSILKLFLTEKWC